MGRGGYRVIETPAAGKAAMDQGEPALARLGGGDGGADGAAGALLGPWAEGKASHGGRVYASDTAKKVRKCTQLPTPKFRSYS